jgi:muconate cycloisomerase
MASAQTFAAYGIDIPVDLNGPQFLADDMIQGKMEFRNGIVSLPQAPGIGLIPDMEKVAKYQMENL